MFVVFGHKSLLITKEEILKPTMTKYIVPKEADCRLRRKVPMPQSSAIV